MTQAIPSSSTLSQLLIEWTKTILSQLDEEENEAHACSWAENSWVPSGLKDSFFAVVTTPLRSFTWSVATGSTCSLLVTVGKTMMVPLPFGKSSQLMRKAMAIRDPSWDQATSQGSNLPYAGYEDETSHVTVDQILIFVSPVPSPSRSSLLVAVRRYAESGDHDRVFTVAFSLL